LKLTTNRHEQSRPSLTPGCTRPQCSRRKVEVVWRETVHFFQALEMVIPIERDATMAGGVKSIQVAEGAAARDRTSKSLRPQEVWG
jgi:hypothetical protein